MKIIESTTSKDLELPLQLQISFEQVFAFYKKYAEDENHPYHKSGKQIAEHLSQFPELMEGFSDFSLIKKYENEIDLMLDGLFPEILTHNEIKVASIPFSFASFKFTKRFESILENAGDDYEFRIRNFEEDEMYIASCTMILKAVYNKQIDFKRPFFFDIPNKTTGITHHYRVAFNGDFSKFIKTDLAPEITDNDIKLLLNSYDNIEVWKEKFPPNSYIFKGFGLMTLFDVTQDQTISSIQANLLQKNNNSIVEELRKNLSEFYKIKDLQLGFSVFDISKQNLDSTRIKKSESLILGSEKEISCSTFFCQGIIHKVFNQQEAMAISDVEAYGKATHENDFYKRLKEKGIKSIILIPIKASVNNDLALLEIASPRAYELNSVNQQKLKDIIPVFEAAVERSAEEHQNILEATIQEHYTSIHPSVKWRFYDAAENYQAKLYKGDIDTQIEDIVFKDVYPLYGQSDIKGSSNARNTAIKQDLTTQLTLAVNVLKEACYAEKLPIYDELMFRVTSYLNEVKNGLNAGDEVGILEFLKREIYPVFNHIKEINKDLLKGVETYMNRLDKNLHVVYEKRKEYENSVTILNEKLANYIDKKEEEAQRMFPHYFERYKTDGVEYNMYIGASLVNSKTYDDLYLYNLRLWQLQLMCEMENVAFNAKQEMEHELEVASLILVHSNPFAIKFRMDEKQFDVDGAYNIRYEIIKKRIDKAHINGTDERLTVPGKIAIVYSQDKDAREYLKYIKFLQSRNLLGKVEKLELEDLQGISGLKALRVEVIYQKNFNEKSTLTIDELMQQIKA